MKITLLSLIASFYFISFQVNGQNHVQQMSSHVSDTAYKYGEIIGFRDLHGRVTIQIDTGQLDNKERLRNQLGKRDALHYLHESYAAAMNDLAKVGWQLIHVYNWSYRETGNEIRWVIRRRIEE